MLNVLNLGAGVQSSMILLMSCRGVLPKVDAAIFADTGWEPKRVYDNLDWLIQQGTDAGIPVYKLPPARDLREDLLAGDGRRFITIPLRTIDESGKRGILRRQCTREFKITPIEQFIRRKLLGLAPRKHASVNSVRQWFGISADEASRMTLAKVRWKTHVYPLCGVPEDMLSAPMTRLMCYEWLAKHYPGREFPRSACIGCPFRSDSEWRDLRAHDEEEWRQAVEFDKKIRNHGGYKGMRSTQFVHRSYSPLQTVDMGADDGQFDWGNECAGVCGV